MSKSKELSEDSKLDTLREISCAISALNMPSEIKDPDAQFLSEKYKMVSYAIEHLERL